ncbi:MAG: thermonuclease family protein [Dehalococcoidia bacterium]|nr:thermonuclease family protein [Dehalococcoidia bacterium]
MHRLAVVICLLALVSIACAGRPSDAPDGSRLPAGVVCEWAPVVRVVDGDTIRVSIAGMEERVRYIGIDTPETAGSPRGEEPFGPEATDYHRKLLGDGPVCLERDVSDRDRFGRLLRYAWLEDGTMVNELLVAAGMARVVTFPPDVRYIEDRLLPAQREAARAARGLWGE